MRHVAALLFKSIRRGEKARLAAQLAQPVAEGRVTGKHYKGE